MRLAVLEGAGTVVDEDFVVGAVVAAGLDGALAVVGLRTTDRLEVVVGGEGEVTFDLDPDRSEPAAAAVVAALRAVPGAVWDVRLVAPDDTVGADVLVLRASSGG